MGLALARRLRRRRHPLRRRRPLRRHRPRPRAPAAVSVSAEAPTTDAANKRRRPRRGPRRRPHPPVDFHSARPRRRPRRIPRRVRPPASSRRPVGRGAPPPARRRVPPPRRLVVFRLARRGRPPRERPPRERPPPPPPPRWRLFGGGDASKSVGAALASGTAASVGTAAATVGTAVAAAVPAKPDADANADLSASAPSQITTKVSLSAHLQALARMPTTLVPEREILAIAKAYDSNPNNPEYRFVVLPQRQRDGGSGDVFTSPAVDELKWRGLLDEVGGEHNAETLWPVPGDGFKTLAERARSQDAGWRRKRELPRRRAARRAREAWRSQRR